MYNIFNLVAGEWVQYALVEAKSRRKAVKGFLAEKHGLKVWKVRAAE